jgi:hypothetical protein
MTTVDASGRRTTGASAVVPVSVNGFSHQVGRFVGVEG